MMKNEKVTNFSWSLKNLESIKFPIVILQTREVSVTELLFTRTGADMKL